MAGPFISSVSRSVPFDNTTNGFVSEDVQSAIEELKVIAANSASPGFTYGRSGNLPNSTWLLNDTVPSNISGRINFLNDCFIKKIFIANQDLSIIKIGIYTHDGNQVNLTLVGTVTTLAQRSNFFDIALSVPISKQIAIRIEPDSLNPGKNMDIGLILKGTLT